MAGNTPATVASQEVYLDGHTYMATGSIQRQLVSQTPQQFRLGEVDQESHPLASIISWSDQRGGIGIDVMEGNEDIFRCWYSTCNLRQKGHITLPRLGTATTSPGAGAGWDFLAELNSKIYAVRTGGFINQYDNVTDTWSIKRAVPDTVTDSITAPVGGTSTLVFARTTGVEYSTDGTTWSQNETDMSYLTWWRDLLFGIDAAGNFYFTSDLSGDWTLLTKFKPQLGTVTSLFTGPDKDGGEIIYAAANDGLYQYDNATESFFKTKLAVPYHPTNGVGAVAWREAVYFPAGLAIYRYSPGVENIVDLVGPDRDDGLPERNQGLIKKLVITHNDLVAVVGPTSQSQVAGARAFRGATAGPTGHRGAFSGKVSTLSGDGVRGSLLGWNTLGWEVRWEDTSAQGSMSTALVSYAYNQYRLWWAAGPSIYWMEIPTGIVNPNRISTTDYAASATWETPWVTANVINFDKTALSIHVDSQHPTSSDTITFSTALDYDENSSAFKSVGVKDRDGDVEFFLPSDENPEGMPFRAIKIRAALARGGTTTNTPDIRKLALILNKAVEPLYGFVVNINLRSEVQGRTWQEQRDDLEAMAKLKKMARFSYRDEGDNDQVFWVRVTGLNFIENTGYDKPNLAQVVLTEVH